MLDLKPPPRHPYIPIQGVETCNELEAHPEQVVRNWYKESTKDFAETHVWAPGERFERLEKLYREHRDRVERVKIFNAGPLGAKARQLPETSRGAMMESSPRLRSRVLE
jgi:hypothetical protein